MYKDFLAFSSREVARGNHKAQTAVVDQLKFITLQTRFTIKYLGQQGFTLKGYSYHIIRHFRSTANSKDRSRKNILIREKIVYGLYTTKLSEFKSFRIQISHFKIRIENLRPPDQTGEFLFRNRSLLCKRQNQPGTKTFWIPLESGTISSSVNLVEN